MDTHTIITVFLSVLVIALIAIIMFITRRKKSEQFTQLELGADECIVIDKSNVKIYEADKQVSIPLSSENNEQIQIFPGTKKKIVRIE